jgi:hypothetical protein
MSEAAFLKQLELVRPRSDSTSSEEAYTSVRSTENKPRSATHPVEPSSPSRSMQAYFELNRLSIS